MKLTFLGGVGTVTGSKYLLEDEEQKILIDCGLFQGLKDLRLRNWAKLPVDPASIDAVILTHAHIDHSGYLPILVRDGFKGPIYCTAPTYDLCKILLPDSAHIHEEDARRANKYGYTKHKPALPLYTGEDAEKALAQFKPVAFGKTFARGDMLSFELIRAGHILGAASIKISDGMTSVVFSGDVGRPHDPVIKPPAHIQEADYLVLESTYGDRLHDPVDPMAQLEAIITQTVARGGSVVIPAFAVGRAQSLIYYLYHLKKAGRIPSVPVYLDSPMAINVTDLLDDHFAEHKISPKECAAMCDSVIYTRTPQQSKGIYNKNNGMPAVIISASGMATGGRVLHHLKYYIGDPRNTILFAGYQAAGTRGARLVHRETEIKIHGKLWPVRAQIKNIESLSAHADYGELLTWLEHFRAPPRATFLTHGEPEAASSLKFKIEDRLGWDVYIPQYLESVEL
jgi:metallo-beta-lactamase family protein